MDKNKFGNLKPVGEAALTSLGHEAELQSRRRRRGMNSVISDKQTTHLPLRLRLRVQQGADAQRVVDLDLRILLLNLISFVLHGWKRTERKWGS